MLRLASLAVLTMTLFLAGCGGAKNPVSEVIFQDAYRLKGAENMEFHFTKDSSLYVWHTGIYELGENEDGKPIVRICLDDTKRELPEDYNFTEYLVTEEKWAVLLTLSTEEFDLESKPMELYLLNGEHGLLENSNFDGTYQIGHDGDSYQYIFQKDGSIAMQITERYFADKTQMTLIDHAGSANYLYEATDDMLVLKNKDGEPVLTLLKITKD